MNKNLTLIMSHHIALVLGILFYGFNIWVAIVVFFASMMWAKWVGSDIVHFYFSHGKYKDCMKSYIYTFLSLFTALGSPISFSASHRQHHKYTDTEKDPHSPAHIGWKRVYFLDWEPQNISPRMMVDFLGSKFQKWIHKHWFTLHLLIIATLLAFDPRLICFVISPFVIYTFHVASATNVLSHLGGSHRNAKELRVLSWWGWKHSDHHNRKKI